MNKMMDSATPAGELNALAGGEKIPAMLDQHRKAGGFRASSITEPLISIIMFVRNGMPHVQRAARSIRTQDYQNFEFVIQDGASDDGTVDYLRGLNDPRIKIVSAHDDGPADAFARAINRCEGDIIGSCLADEELMPDALSRVVELFTKHPHLGAVTGDAHITDLAGNTYAKFTGAPFNIIKYLNGEYCPYWCSSFFSVSALRSVGVFGDRWSKASLEFEIWCRLAIASDILYVPEIFSKYAHHAGQLSQAGDRVEQELEARLTIIRDHLFGHGKYFGEDYELRESFTLLQLINLHQHLIIWNPKAAEKIMHRIIDADLLREFNSTRAGEQHAAAPLKRCSPTAARQLSSEYQHLPMHEFIIPRGGKLGRLYNAVTPQFIRKMIPRDLKMIIARAMKLRGGKNGE